MDLRKTASLTLIGLAVLFCSVAILSDLQDVGPCPNFIPGRPNTCTQYFPGTNIAIEFAVEVFLILSALTLGAGAAIFLISRAPRHSSTAPNPTEFLS